ncbi:AfsR/SARP family transcriptional regulator [Streptomyces sp. NPDC094034]|uniref:AfsR/SARP family transcriptional regulator n=1 Tax=Streptomyces sp. NPDC094034 TaxID=3155309 RepID=UPI003320FC9E
MPDVQVRVLGPLEVAHPGGCVAFSGVRQGALLAMLALKANAVVPVAKLREAIWGESPPDSVSTQLRICVSRLRREFARLGAENVIETHPSGYRLHVTENGSDLGMFENLLARGRAATAEERPGDAARLTREALDLWRGPAACGLESTLVQMYAAKANEDRAAAYEELFDLELQLGQHRKILGELFEHSEQKPYGERLCAQLMLALYRSDRQAEALEAYQRLRGRLSGELGLEPCGRLRQLYEMILAHDERLELLSPWTVDVSRPALLGFSPRAHRYLGDTAEGSGLCA